MIRQAAETDLRPCAEILDDSLLWERYGRSVDEALTFFESEFKTGSEMWVYEDSSEVIGYLVLIPRGMMGEFPFVRALGVRRDRRGNGIGTELLGFAEERMFRLKPFLFMMVSDFNTGAQRLYTRLGYEKIGEITDYKKKGIAEFMLLKRKPV